MYSSKKTSWLLVVLLVLLSIQCDWRRDARTADTRRMVERLNEIADTAQQTDVTPEHLSSPAGQFTRTKRVPPFAHAKHEIARARRSLYSGDTRKAIERLEQLWEQLQNDEVFGFGSDHTAIRELLAVSYLRLGQQENCLANHETASCLFPVPEDGIYTHQASSRAAIKLYMDMLQRRPENLEARWLLNIAYMTIGEYPQSVPDSLVISPKAFVSEHDVEPFTDVAPGAGLAEVGLSGGSVMEDFDGDGDLDVMASSWGVGDQLRYYRNNGDGTFSDWTLEAGLEGLVGGLNLIHGDFNNDGAADVLVLRGAWHGKAGEHPNSLLRNNGDGTFSDVTEKAGLLSFHPTQTAAWGDFNNDGWLDLFIGNETTPGSQHPCELYRNNGDGTFTNVAKAVGLDVHGFVKGANWGDYDNDGRLDLYLSLLGEPNMLYRNDGADHSGHWQFIEVSQSAGVQEPLNSFPTWFWDYNNDGQLDLFVSGFGAGYVVDVANVAVEYLGGTPWAATPRLYKNDGNGRFSDVTKEVNLDRVIYGMGANYGDIDNDGFPDLYVGTGGPRFTSLIPNRLFRNRRGAEFQEVTSAARVGHLGKGHGVSFGDVDSDGDQDVFTVIGGAMQGDTYRNALFQNPGNENHWIALRLRGVQSNAAGIGARIRVVVDTEEGPREIHTIVSTGGSFGASSLQQEVGLGKASSIRTLEIRWPASGVVQTFHHVAMNRFYRVQEDKNVLQPIHESLGAAKERYPN